MYQNEKTCRLCLLDVSSLVPIFSTVNVAETSSIQMKIMELANVQVYAGDGLPCSVCENCHKLLDEYHAFKTQIEKSDVILRHQLSTSQTDPLSIDSKLDESVTAHGEFVKAETLVIKDEVIDEEHVERILQPSSHSPSPHLSDAMVNDDRDDDDDNDNDNDPGGGDMDVEEEETDPLASDTVEPSALDEANAVVKSVDNPIAITRAIVSTTQTIPLVTSSPIVANQPTNLLLVATPLIIKSSNQAVSSTSGTATSFVALPTNVSSTFVTVPTSAIKPPIQAPSATVTSKTIKKKTTKRKQKLVEIKDEPIPSTSTADSTETGESTASTSGEQPQVNMNENMLFGSEDETDVEMDTESLSKNKTTKSRNKMCPVCGILLENFKLYRQHISQHKYKTCDICDKSFPKWMTVFRHKKYVHGSNFGYTPCHICGKLFKRAEYLGTHIRFSHSDKGMTKADCDVCQKTFKSEESLKIHKKKVHVDHQIPCEVCGKRFKNQTYLTLHERTHSTETHLGHVCPVCGKTVKRIKKHMSVMHFDRVISPCDLCGKTFPSENSLQRHKEIRHSDKEKSHMCEICGASFHFKDLLRNHYVVHSNERNFKCDICDKTFKLKSVLQTHQRVHYAIEPYVCKACGASFKWKNSYDKHCSNCVISDIGDETHSIFG